MGIFKKEKRYIDELAASFYSTIYGTSNSSYWAELNNLQNESLYSAIKIISETVASLKVNAFQKSDKGPIKLKNHNIQKVLDSPNPTISAFTFWETFVFHLLYHGNAYAFITRWPNSGYIKDLILLEPKDIDPFIGDDGFKKYKNILTGKVYTHEQIFHVLATSYDGIKGIPPVQQFQKQIAEGLSADNYIKRFFEKGIHTNVILELPPGFSENGDPDTIKRRLEAVRNQFIKLFGGVNQSHGVMTVDNGTKLTSLKQDTNKDSQILELRTEAIKKICRIYRIPEHMMGILDHATYSNISQMSADFYKQCIAPILKRIESSADMQLIDYRDKGKVYIKFNATSVLRGTDEERSVYYEKMKNLGVYSINEIRELEDLPMLEDEYANYHQYNLSNAFIEKPKKEEEVKSNEL